MRTLKLLIIAAVLAFAPQAQSETTFTNFIRQVQYPAELVYDMTVPQVGEEPSPLPIEDGGARFELWAVASNGETITSYLLSSKFVGTYIPVATLNITSEDTTSSNPRTRADRPFSVTYDVQGLLNGIDDPKPSKSVNLYWHVQSYGEDGNGENIVPANATLVDSATISENGAVTLNFNLTSVPATDISKARGEERFTIYSLEDFQAPASEIVGNTIQIWPVANGTIAGINTGDLVRYQVPQLTLTLNDLYPSSTTYAQVYTGEAILGTVGKIIPGSALVIDEPSPRDHTLVVDNYAQSLGADGVYTIELLTKTPFGIDRLAYVTFNLDRTMKINGSFSTIE